MTADSGARPVTPTDSEAESRVPGRHGHGDSELRPSPRAGGSDSAPGPAGPAVDAEFEALVALRTQSPALAAARCAAAGPGPAGRARRRAPVRGPPAPTRT